MSLQGLRRQSDQLHVRPVRQKHHAAPQHRRRHQGPALPLDGSHDIVVRLQLPSSNSLSESLH